MKSLYSITLAILSIAHGALSQGFTEYSVRSSEGTSLVASKASSNVESLLAPYYKDVTVSRGYKYHYYFSAAAAGKPTLLLNHGFPSLAVDWYRQIVFFKKKGYGLVVPDQLGYGGTDRPEEPNVY